MILVARLVSGGIWLTALVISTKLLTSSQLSANIGDRGHSLVYQLVQGVQPSAKPGKVRENRKS